MGSGDLSHRIGRFQVGEKPSNPIRHPGLDSGSSSSRKARGGGWFDFNLCLNNPLIPNTPLPVMIFAKRAAGLVYVVNELSP